MVFEHSRLISQDEGVRKLVGEERKKMQMD